MCVCARACTRACARVVHDKNDDDVDDNNNDGEVADQIAGATVLHQAGTRSNRTSFNMQTTVIVSVVCHSVSLM